MIKRGKIYKQYYGSVHFYVLYTIEIVCNLDINNLVSVRISVNVFQHIFCTHYGGFIAYVT